MTDLSRLKARVRKAPADLLPRVMAAVAAEQAKPWWKREWWSWPAAARAGYALGVAALAGAAAAAAWRAAPAVAPVQAALAQARAAAEAGAVVIGALWRLGGAPLQALTLAMAVSCAAFGAGLSRLLEPARRTI